jgi:hypothetical protein
MSTPADDPTFHRLDWRDGLALAGTLVLGRVWVAVDQELLPQRLLMPAFFAVVLLLQAGFFVFVRPARPFALARTVALTLGTATAALILCSTSS